MMDGVLMCFGFAMWLTVVSILAMSVVLLFVASLWEEEPEKGEEKDDNLPKTV